jgi:hypothetical protein
LKSGKPLAAPSNLRFTPFWNCGKNHQKEGPVDKWFRASRFPKNPQDIKTIFCGNVEKI